jgi:hypothetical protein
MQTKKDSKDTNCIHIVRIRATLYPQVLIDLDSSVALELDPTPFQEGGRWGHTNAHDHEISRDYGSIHHHTPCEGWITLLWNDLFDFGGHVELDALRFVGLTLYEHGQKTT